MNRNRTTVQRGYMGQDRVLVASDGRVFRGGEWAHPDTQVVKVPGVYERWCDVPAAWLGGCPYWRS